MRQDRPGRLGAPPLPRHEGSRTTVRAGSNGSAHAEPAVRRTDWLGAALLVSGAALILVSAVVHFVLWREAYGFLPVIGALFLLNAVSGLVIAVAVLFARGLSARLRRWWTEPLIFLLGWGFAALTLAAFLLSVTRGLFGFQESLSGAPQEIAGIAEALTLIVMGWALVRSLAGPRRPTSLRRGGR